MTISRKVPAGLLGASRWPGRFPPSWERGAAPSHPDCERSDPERCHGKTLDAVRCVIARSEATKQSGLLARKHFWIASLPPSLSELRRTGARNDGVARHVQRSAPDMIAQFKPDLGTLLHNQQHPDRLQASPRLAMMDVEF